MGNQTGSTAEKDTAVRLRGGVKSPILTQAVKGDTLEILEQMETWSKVKTVDAVIGYVEINAWVRSRRRRKHR